MILKLGMEHQREELYKVYINRFRFRCLVRCNVEIRAPDFLVFFYLIGLFFELKLHISDDRNFSRKEYLILKESHTKCVNNESIYVNIYIKYTNREQ